MRLSPTAKNVMLDALDESVAAGAKFGSLHNAYSTSGANEISGGFPAYARMPAVWDPASGGAKALAAAIVFNVGASAVVGWVGFWDAVTGGNFLGMTPNGGTAPEAFATLPPITSDGLECPAHPFLNGDTVVVWGVSSGLLPIPLAEGTVYYIVNINADDFKLSLTLGGAPINLTSAGGGFVQKIVVETFGGQGTHTITAATMGLD